MSFDVQIIGKRSRQEDTYIISENGDWKIVGVFDGHAGNGTSDWLKYHFVEEITKYLPSSNKQDELEKAIKRAFTSIDSLIRCNVKDGSGSTAIVAIYNKELLILINLGDSRGVLFDSEGKILLESIDHKPNNSEERKRIEKSGGDVKLEGVWRVNGILALSRAFGDFEMKKEDDLKNSVISWQPDIQFYSLKNYSPADKCYLLLASDGFWDIYTEKIKNQNPRKRITQTLATQNAINIFLDLNERTAKNLLENTVPVSNYSDNTTIIVIDVLGNTINIDELNKTIDEGIESDDEEYYNEQLISGSLISRKSQQIDIKELSAEDRRSLSSWLSNRLSEYIYILTAINVNKDTALNKNIIKTVITNIYGDPWSERILYSRSEITDTFRNLMKKWRVKRNTHVDYLIFNSIWLLAILVTNELKKYNSNFKLLRRKYKRKLLESYKKELTKIAESTNYFDKSEIAFLRAFERIYGILCELFDHSSRMHQIEHIILTIKILFPEYVINEKYIARLKKAETTKISVLAKRFDVDKTLIKNIDNMDVVESPTALIFLANAIEQYRLLPINFRIRLQERFIKYGLPNT